MGARMENKSLDTESSAELSSSPLWFKIAIALSFGLGLLMCLAGFLLSRQD
jgi:hypothetical protein